MSSYCNALYTTQEIECTGTSDTLNLLSDDSKMSVKLGRVLRKGEYKVKIFELELNAAKDEVGS